MLKIIKSEYEVENCAKKEFNNALDNFITRVWRKSLDMNLKDIVNYIYDNTNKICLDNIERVTYHDLREVTRCLVYDLHLDRSMSTQSMILDEIYTISYFYNRCNTTDEDF